MTIGKFYRVTGESTQHRGVEPDVPLASADRHQGGRRERARVRAALGPHRRGALQGERAAAPSAPSVATLATEEDVRAQHDPDYRWLVSDIAALDEVREQKTVSLNLKARREERTRIDKERLERENSRRAAKNLPRVQERRGAGQGQGHDRCRARPGDPGHGGRAERRARPAGAPQKTARSG